MAPPSSYDFDIDTIPFTAVVTQAVFNVANEVWFRYVASEPIVIGTYTNSGGTFTPRTTVWESDGTTQVGPNHSNTAGWWALPAAGVYYIRVVRIGAGPSDFDFTFNADTRPLDVVDIAVGDLIINDDASGYEAVILDGTTGEVKFFSSHIPSGEYGAILPSNISLWHDKHSKYSAINKVALIDENLEHIVSLNCGITGDPRIAVDLANDQFYVTSSSGELWTVSEAGVAANTGFVFSGSPVFPDIIAVNPAGTVLYYADCYGPANKIIYRLDLTTFLPLSNLVDFTVADPSITDLAVTPNLWVGDIVVFPNGNVHIPYYASAFNSYGGKTVDSSGTGVYGYGISSPYGINHFAYIDGDLEYAVRWMYLDGGLAVAAFETYSLINGNVTNSFTLDLFSQGENMNGTDMFGPSTSCTMLRFATGIEPVYTETRVTQVVTEVMTILEDLGGIYHLPPGKTHDSYYTDIEVKIPNPTIKTALIGE